MTNYFVVRTTYRVHINIYTYNVKQTAHPSKHTASHGGWMSIARNHSSHFIKHRNDIDNDNWLLIYFISLCSFLSFYFRLSFGNTLPSENLFANENNQSPLHIRYGNVNMFIQLRMAILPQFVSCFGILCTYRIFEWNAIGGDDISLSHDLFVDWLLYNSNRNVWHHVDNAALRANIETDRSCI